MFRWFCLVCFVFFWLLWGFFVVWDGAFGVPFGGGDVDVYLGWFGGGDIDVRGLYTHFVFLGVVGVLGDPGVVLLWFVPFLLCVCLPLSFYWCFSGLLDCEWDVLLGVFGCCFCSFGLLFFGVGALWSQLFASFFFFLSLGFFLRGCVLWGVVLGCVAVVVHPFVLGVYGLVFCGLLCSVSVRWGCLFVLGCVLFFGLVGFDFWEYTVWSGFGFREPPLYNMVFVFTFPLLWFFALFGWRCVPSRQLRCVLLVLGVVMPFSHLGRGLVYLHFFLVLFGVLGYRRLRCLVVPWVFDVLVLVLVCLWFDNVFGFLMLNLWSQLPGRGLSQLVFFDLSGFSNI